MWMTRSSIMGKLLSRTLVARSGRFHYSDLCKEIYFKILLFRFHSNEKRDVNYPSQLLLFFFQNKRHRDRTVDNRGQNITTESSEFASAEKTALIGSFMFR